MTELRYHPRVKRDLKQLDPLLRNEIRDELLPSIQKNPQIGISLKGQLKGILSYHFKYQNIQYRIAYLYSQHADTITILMIGKRENFYAVLTRRLS
ncbi:MAG: type II toxin-antitoxin system RelE/ParE family toxin [Spirochaetota bacterium]